VTSDKNKCLNVAVTCEVYKNEKIKQKSASKWSKTVKIKCLFCQESFEKWPPEVLFTITNSEHQLLVQRAN